MPRINVIMLGAPKPTNIPIIASHRCERALGFPVKNEKDANISPRTAHSGKMVFTSLD